MEVDQIHTEWIELKVSDGTIMRAYVARPQAGTHPGLIVLQEAFGVNSHIRDVTERFAREGFCAIAPELYHRTAPGEEFPYDNFDAVRSHLNAVTPDTVIPDLQSVFNGLRSQSFVDGTRISSIGFCMGGRVSFIANSFLPLSRAVSFYGGGIAPALLDRAATQHAPLLFFWGELDKKIPPEQRSALTSELKKLGKRYINVEIGFADHGFFCDQRPSYQPHAARHAWVLALDFLRQ